MFGTRPEALLVGGSGDALWATLNEVGKGNGTTSGARTTVRG